MQSGRYFLAIALPDGHRKTLLEMRDRSRGVAWTRPENLHLTLRFIGEMEGELAERLAGALQAIRVEPFILPLEGAGAFPQRGRARVLWVGVGAGHPRLFQLRKEVDDTLLRVGVEADLRNFHPHVTTARIRDEASMGAVSQWLKRWRAFEGPSFRVERFGLYRSVLEDGQTRYRNAAEFELTGGASD